MFKKRKFCKFIFLVSTSAFVYYSIHIAGHHIYKDTVRMEKSLAAMFKKRKFYKFIFLVSTSAFVFYSIHIIGHHICKDTVRMGRHLYEDRRDGNRETEGIWQSDTRFRALNNHVRNVCQQTRLETPSFEKTWIPFAFNRLSYCPIPKSGTTFLERTLSPTLEKQNNDSKTTIPEHQKRFVIVREPYSRLVSAFFSKSVGHPYWWELNARLMIRPFRQNASEISLRCGHDVTFPEYVKFVLEMHRTHSNLDPHFLRITDVCNVCLDNPDYIAKLENIKEDMRYILNIVNVTGRTGQSFIEVQHLAKLFMSFKNNFENCGPMCNIIERYWWGQQATGLISFDIDLPLKREQCDNVTGDQLADIAWRAHQQSIGRINKHELKKKVMTKLFRQVPMQDRKELKHVFGIDCLLFGYDPEPAFVFPELYRN